MGSGLKIATSISESLRPAQDRHLPELGENLVATQNRERAPIVFPSTKAKFMTMRRPTESWAADAKRPWARPTSWEVRLGPTVSGSSKTLTTPRHVAEEFVEARLSRRSAAARL
ncbi:hypothetical protein HPP92_003130 [Vanilla planifolia]|uniref:Uncharacterized protein n=1 Tax=Vanilla planifolia TaxID=51239 RepID=A0A835RUL5_VANPL|nr:hypothetical protein HPP92_003130 [Vanilla planifolia]